MNKITTKCINGTIAVGDMVVSTPDDEYGCLVGRVKEIALVGTPEHDATENDTDDVYVDFSQVDYSDKRIKEIEELFSEIYDEPRSIEECAIDEVVMDPDCLIRITDMDGAGLNNLLESGYNAACYCYGVLSSLTAQPDNSASEDTPSVTKTHIFDTIASALTVAGYKVLDGERKSVIVRHSQSDTDYEIKVEELPG